MRRITSSVSGEGKTYISINMASAMALSGKRTCILGMDLRNPKLSKYLDVSNKKGLSTFLINKNTSEEIILETKYENFFVVPSGPVPPNPSELLLKDKLADFFKHLEEQFDIIIMDCPPVGLVSETMDLLRFSDINLFIIRYDYTHKNHLLMINDLYTNDQVSNIYGIFNGLKNGGDTYDFAGYNYGYGYSYSYLRNGKYGSNYYDNESKTRNNFLTRILSIFKA
jgi:capsular exopolysaccharide synthesis family protein